MKTKRFNKKLSLNKTTISNLNNNEMISVKGGLPTESIDTLCTVCQDSQLPRSCNSVTCLWICEETEGATCYC